VRHIGNTIHIDDIPDAVLLVRLSNAKARRLADLALHKSDLDLAHDCLATLNDMPDASSTMKQALWRSAIVHLMKCFGSSVRFQLEAKQVYKGEPQAALEVFTFFKQLRDKHVAHDDNAFARALVGAAINDGSKPYKVEQVVCIDMFVGTLNADTERNLGLLIDRARAWVVGAFDALAAVITSDLETESYDKLKSRGVLEYQVPTFAEVAVRRTR